MWILFAGRNLLAGWMYVWMAILAGHSRPPNHKLQNSYFFVDITKLLSYYECNSFNERQFIMGTKERRQRETESRRRDILEAARHLFWQKGFAGTSIPQIAHRAEVAPGTIYLYFPSKETLYVELLMAGYGILRQRLTAEADRAAPPRELAERLIDVFLGFADEYPEYYEIIFFLVQKERSGGWEGHFPAESVARVRALEVECKSIASGILENAGIAEPDIRVETLEAVWSMLSGVVFYFGSTPDGARVAARAKEMILRAIFSGFVTYDPDNRASKEEVTS
jgi:AcrR family transcriptional regulator